VSFIEDRLRQVIDSDGLSKIGSIPVADTNQLAEKNISSDEHYNELFVAISVLILCISPIIWFFSQSLYYFKREKEFNIIQSMGANGSDIRKIYLLGGVSMAIMSLIVSILLSYIASYLMFYVFNVVVPNFSGEYIRYIFYMPWYALVISVVMSVACGFFSAYIPYKSYFKNRYSLENGGSGVQDDE
ncbi:MAG: FtsX-like permease family protein, partial [Candidatus Avispirillum sp.]